MKLTNKNKRSVRRKVDIDLGVEPPKSTVFTNKKVYSRKKKHKNAIHVDRPSNYILDN